MKILEILHRLEFFGTHAKRAYSRKWTLIPWKRVFRKHLGSKYSIKTQSRPSPYPIISMGVFFCKCVGDKVCACRVCVCDDVCTRVGCEYVSVCVCVSRVWECKYAVWVCGVTSYLYVQRNFHFIILECGWVLARVIVSKWVLVECVWVIELACEWRSE